MRDIREKVMTKDFESIQHENFQLAKHCAIFAEKLNSGSVREAVLYGREHLKDYLDQPDVRQLLEKVYEGSTDESTQIFWKLIDDPLSILYKQSLTIAKTLPLELELFFELTGSNR